MITRKCAASGQEFIIEDEDLDFYAKMGVITEEQKSALLSFRGKRSDEKSQEKDLSQGVDQGLVRDDNALEAEKIPGNLLIGLPTLCPEERQRRRSAQRNQRCFYKRKCDATKKEIISLYDENYPGKVFCPEAYFSDNWDPKDFAQDFDFSKAFFPQFKNLFLSVPRLSLIHIGNDSIENSNFTNDLYRVKNCYLVSDGEQSRDSMYGETFFKLDGCLDFLFLENSSFCYECINCKNGYELFFSVNCENCQESWFLENCIGCRNCFGCKNLFQKEYFIYNKKYSREEYENFMGGFYSGKYSVIQKLKQSTKNFWGSIFEKYFHGKRIENCTGDYLTQSKDSFECYDCNGLRDCKYCGHLLLGAKDSQDYNVWGDNTELVYESVCCGANIKDVMFSYYCSNNAESILYSMYCWFGVENIFGCVGLSKAKHCILNKQYTKEEYENLVPKIIAHMKETGEWGQFFPISMSPFAYNETVAQEYFPLSKEEALKKGYKWKDEEPIDIKKSQEFFWDSIPDDIKDVSDDILKTVLYCERTKKPYKIQKAELAFYQKMNLPIPRLHPDERHKDRMKLRNPRKLWKRTCADCQKEIQTTFAPERPEKVLCEECYLKVVQ